MTTTQAQDQSVTQRLAEVKAKRAKLREAQEAAAALEADERALVAEELAFANEEAIAAASAKLGARGIAFDVLDTHLGVIIVKRPAPSAFKEFSELESKAITFEALEAYARKWIEYPALPKYDDIARELPGIVPELALKANALRGSTAREQAKK